MKLAVVAFGGNALLRPEDRGTQEEQIARAKKLSFLLPGFSATAFATATE